MSIPLYPGESVMKKKIQLRLTLNWEMGGGFILGPKGKVPPELGLTEIDLDWGISEGQIANLLDKHSNLEIILTRD